jgi:hypothetical protein
MPTIATTSSVGISSSHAKRARASASDRFFFVLAAAWVGVVTALSLMIFPLFVVIESEQGCRTARIWGVSWPALLPASFAWFLRFSVPGSQQKKDILPQDAGLAR